MAYISFSEAARRAGVYVHGVHKLADAGIIQRHTVKGHRFPMLNDRDVATIKEHLPARYLPPVRVAIGNTFTDPTPAEIRDRCEMILANRKKVSPHERCRQRILWILSHQGGLTIDLVATALGASTVTASARLKELEAVGLVESIGITHRRYFCAESVGKFAAMDTADTILARFRTRAERYARRSRRPRQAAA
ncbi:hypothetical protein Enr13x_28070 [Stieleria neptunia]|uniref:Uncharacterized protein n=1 Tax=Stieleria neptunia TaxID=2527979 RepID=A0A518HQ39_9BACT|nr:winged helix-turn-helix domain-containing protein [Stieleria neptunia]QDV42955.1 hypothetical protein Enr13x_28070 [Stieleria neptunia]